MFPKGGGMRRLCKRPKFVIFCFEAFLYAHNRDSTCNSNLNMYIIEVSEHELNIYFSYLTRTDPNVCCLACNRTPNMRGYNLQRFALSSC